MLNSKTRKIFKDLGSIGNSAIIRYPLTPIIQLDRALISFIDLEALGEEQFEEFGIYHLSEFLSLVDLYEGGEIKRNGNVIELKNESSSQKYKTSDLDVLEIFDMPSAVLEKIQETTPEVTFTLTSDRLDKVKKVSSLLSLKSFIIEAQGDELNLVACELSENGAYMNEAVHNISGAEVTNDTKVVFDMANILKIPSIDFEVSIIKNQKTGNYISLWKAIDEPISIIATVQRSL